MIKLSGHHIVFIIEDYRNEFVRAESALKKLKKNNGERLYDDATVEKVIGFCRELVAHPEQEFEVIMDQPDDLCKLCCNYEETLPSGCKLDPDSGQIGYSDDYTSLARMSFSGDEWVPGSIRRIKDILVYLPHVPINLS